LGWVGLGWVVWVGFGFDCNNIIIKRP
jgi:hypothetical protein